MNDCCKHHGNVDGKKCGEYHGQRKLGPVYCCEECPLLPDDSTGMVAEFDEDGNVAAYNHTAVVTGAASPVTPQSEASSDRPSDA